MGRTVIPDNRGPRMMVIKIIALACFLLVVAGMYWVYDATNYWYSLKPEFLLSSSEQSLREMDRRFDQIKERYVKSGNREAAQKAAWRFQQEFASKSQNLSSRGAHRRAEKLLKELQRFQKRVE